MATLRLQACDLCGQPGGLARVNLGRARRVRSYLLCEVCSDSLSLTRILDRLEARVTEARRVVVSMEEVRARRT